MTAELAVITNPNEIASLPAEQRGALTKGTNPTPIAEFKAWAATVAEMTKQKGLAEEIQMVRRAERGIGLAIRYCRPDNRPEPGPMSVYVVYGMPGEVLYIGQTSDVRRRLLQHSRQADWWSWATSVSVIHGITRDEAASIERAAIESVLPLGNTHYTKMRN